MTLSYEEAAAIVTAPGERYEVVDVGDHRAFKNVLPSLRDIFATARRRGDTTFLVYEDERWSFADVMRHVDALGALLVERYGVRRGDRVAIGMRNYPEWVLSFAAVTSIGAISVSLNAWWTEDELDYALGDSMPKVLIADQARAELARDAVERLGIRTLVVRAEPGTAQWADRWEEELRLGSALPDVTVGPDDDATILYTAGTTGHPKGAVSTHGAIIQALMGFGCRTAMERLRRPEENTSRAPSVFILIVPLFHVTGCIPVMMSCFTNGLKLVMTYKWDADRALELIERERVTHFIGVPTQSFDLLQSARFGEFDTSSLVSVGGGGAPSPPELVKRVATNFGQAKPGIGYGLTETNSYGPQNSGIDYTTHPTSTGRATPVLQIDVRDGDGRSQPPGERGEIWLKGPNLFRGYWGKPEASAETIVDGWLRTGDIGRVDDEGFLYIEDRAKDMVLRAGENVYCAEVEAAIYEHPAVYEAAVFGVPHERLGEEVAAAVYAKPGQTLTVADVQAHVAARLASFKVPTVVLLLDEQLPRNAAGKILKRDLRDRLTT
jgi:long-chain acyl-CoA synthetase